MRIIWRTLPRLALPAAVGLGAAYLLTSFVPRPAPSLRPPEDLRAGGQGYAEESPVRAILEKNVLNLESTPFATLGVSLLSEPAPVPLPAPRPNKAQAPAFSPPKSPPQAAFAPLEPAVTPQAGGGLSATAPLSGGPQVQGQAVTPSSPSGLQDKVSPGTPAPAAPAAQNGQAKAGSSATPTAASAQQKAQGAAAAVGQGIEGFRLVGVIAGGDRPLAMLQVDGAAVSLRPGEQARGWTLMTVEPNQVLLRRGQELRRVSLGGRQP